MSTAALYDYNPPHRWTCGQCGDELTAYELEDIEVQIDSHQGWHDLEHA